ncbi:zinc finger protein 180 isoform X8 [Myotis daubentonii]|uniref:zinc finger protein 180 isoform X8 n=1 Tax=Myotis daubentonii TaxID=98922 RepID=UPI002873482E|nr:zinc finger protein 180 isoform X8 [Myotis daubentonii]
MHFRVRPEAQPLCPPHTHPPPQARTLALAAHLGPSQGLPERPCEYRDGAGTELASPEFAVCRIGDLRPLPVRDGEHGRAGGEAPRNPDGGLCADANSFWEEFSTLYPKPLEYGLPFDQQLLALPENERLKECLSICNAQGEFDALWTLSFLKRLSSRLREKIRGQWPSLPRLGNCTWKKRINIKAENY